MVAAYLDEKEKEPSILDDRPLEVPRLQRGESL
jgi:hypothetical protein